MNNYIPLPNLVFLSLYCYLQTKFFPVHLRPKGVGHKSTGKNEKWQLTVRSTKNKVRKVLAELLERAKRARGRSPIAKVIYPSQKIW